MRPSGGWPVPVDPGLEFGEVENEDYVVALVKMASGVLSVCEADRAAAIWGEAQNVFAGKPELDQVRAAARDAGVAE